MSEWVTEPPIVMVGQNMRQICRVKTRRLKVAITRWSPGSGKLTASARIICDLLDEKMKDGELEQADRVFVYDFCGSPVCVMLANIDEGYIHYLVSHPGTEGAGATMCEYLLNLLVSRGKKARVQLHALDDAALDSYVPIGFTSSGTGFSRYAMKLKPDGNTKWAQAGGKWRYVSKKNPGELYAR